MTIDFSDYVGHNLIVRCEGDLYKYETSWLEYSNSMPFEDLPVEIRERVAVLLTAPVNVEIKGVGCRSTDYFILKDN